MAAPGYTVYSQCVHENKDVKAWGDLVISATGNITIEAGTEQDDTIFSIQDKNGVIDIGTETGPPRTSFYSPYFDMQIYNDSNIKIGSTDSVVSIGSQSHTFQKADMDPMRPLRKGGAVLISGPGRGGDVDPPNPESAVPYVWSPEYFDLQNPPVFGPGGAVWREMVPTFITFTVTGRASEGYWQGSNGKQIFTPVYFDGEILTEGGGVILQEFELETHIPYRVGTFPQVTLGQLVQTEPALPDTVFQQYGPLLTGIGASIPGDGASNRDHSGHVDDEYPSITKVAVTFISKRVCLDNGTPGWCNIGGDGWSEYQPAAFTAHIGLMFYQQYR